METKNLPSQMMIVSTAFAIASRYWEEKDAAFDKIMLEFRISCWDIHKDFLWNHHNEIAVKTIARLFIALGEDVGTEYFRHYVEEIEACEDNKQDEKDRGDIFSNDEKPMN